MAARTVPRLLLWALLALPAALIAIDAAGRPAADLEELLPVTGTTSARLLIVALMLTPLARAFPASRAMGALLRHRRALGVAAFGYAALHTLFYMIAMGRLADMLAELGATGIWTGWAALALMLPCAITSNAAAMRALGRGWKRLQRLAYPAGLLTLIHWVAVHDDRAAAIAHFAPLALLQLWRIGARLRPPLPAAA